MKTTGIYIGMGDEDMRDYATELFTVKIKYEYIESREQLILMRYVEQVRAMINEGYSFEDIAKKLEVDTAIVAELVKSGENNYYYEVKQESEIVQQLVRNEFEKFDWKKDFRETSIERCRMARAKNLLLMGQSVEQVAERLDTSVEDVRFCGYLMKEKVCGGVSKEPETENEAYQKGYAAGEVHAKKECMRIMVVAGWPKEVIANWTGCSIEEIEVVKKAILEIENSSRSWSRWAGRMLESDEFSDEEKAKLKILVR